MPVVDSVEKLPGDCAKLDEANTSSTNKDRRQERKLHHLLLPSAATPAADALFVDAGKSATTAPMVVCN